MTTKVISGTYPSGYVLDVADGYTALSITAGGYVQGRGVTIEGNGGGLYSLTNSGRIVGADTFGYIGAYVNGGSVTNGSAKDTTALIQGWRGVQLGNNKYNLADGAGTVTNFGRIYGDTRSGVLIYGYLNEVGGGVITNGSAKDLTATIHGGAASDGVAFEGPAATVKNFGTITGANGAFLALAGTVTNGSSMDTTAVLGTAALGAEIGTSVSAGVMGYQGAVTVSNFAFIGGADGVYLGAGGVVTNGAAGANSTAEIVGNPYYNVNGARRVTAAAYLLKGGKVNNFGTLYGYATNGVILADGGTVINGAANATSATIDAHHTTSSGPVYGVEIKGGTGVISNFGTIEGDFGIYVMEGTLKATNLGTIIALQEGDGVYVGQESDGGVITNGSATAVRATIEGLYGVDVLANSTTVVNYGTIAGTSGVSATFTGVDDTLVVEAGSKFVGNVQGAGETLVLANGTGKISGDQSVVLTVSGSMAATSFYEFNTLVIGAAATFSSKAAVNLEAGAVIDSQGSLTLGGGGANSVVNAGLMETTGAGLLTLAGVVTNTGTVVASGGTLTIARAISGTSLVEVDGGRLDLATSTTQAVTFTTRGGVLELGRSQTYAAAITGFSKTPGKTSLDLDDITYVDPAQASFSGTKTGGVLTVSDGVHTASIALQVNFLSSGFVTASDNHGGVLVTTAPPPAPIPPQTPISPHRLIEAMAGLGAPASNTVICRLAPPARENLLSGPRTQIA